MDDLKTEKAGRLFAMDVLDRLKNATSDETTAYPFASHYEPGEEVAPYRTGAQWDGLYLDLCALGGATDEALRGFASILTDALAGSINMDVDFYRELERDGRFMPWGTEGERYARPEVLKNVIHLMRRLKGK